MNQSTILHSFRRTTKYDDHILNIHTLFITYVVLNTSAAQHIHLILAYKKSTILYAAKIYCRGLEQYKIFKLYSFHT